MARFLFAWPYTKEIERLHGIIEGLEAEVERLKALNAALQAELDRVKRELQELKDRPPPVVEVRTGGLNALFGKGHLTQTTTSLCFSCHAFNPDDCSHFTFIQPK